MNAKGILAVIIATQAIGGCTTAAFSTIQPVSSSLLRTRGESRHVVDKNYRLGETHTAYVGQPIVRVKDYTITTTSSEPYFVSQVPITATWWMLGPTVTFPSGTQFPILGTVSHAGQVYLAISPPHPTYQSIPMLVQFDGRYNNKNMARNGLVFEPGNVDPSGVRYSPSVLQFIRPTKEEVQKTGGFINFEILYSGATKEAIRMLYREFTPDDMARPAYSQELVYAPGPSVVRFRNMTIRVLNADNQQIAYVVEADSSP